MLAKAYQRVLGLPFVYDKVRPFVLGGLELSPFYSQLKATEADVILDIGCGTGNALDYLDRFAKYHGFDTDPMAIASAKRRAGTRRNVTLQEGYCTAHDVASIDPSLVVLCGVLHHLDDQQAVDLMQAASSAPRFVGLFTLDVAYLDGVRHSLSNALARLDRGRHVRRPEAYRRLIERAGLCVETETMLWNHPTRHVARYFGTTVRRRT